MCDLLAGAPYMVATLAQTIHLHRPRRAQFLSPTTKPSTGAMIRNAHTSGSVGLPTMLEELLIDAGLMGHTGMPATGPLRGSVVA
jgi:hypothetical protein